MCTSNLLPFNHIYDDDDFMQCISDDWDRPNPIPFDLLRNDENIFIPFDLNENFDNPMSEIDPDMQ